MCYCLDAFDDNLTCCALIIPLCVFSRKPPTTHYYSATLMTLWLPYSVRQDNIFSSPVFPYEIHYQPLSSDPKQNTSLRFQHNLKKASGCLGEIKQQVHILILYFFPSHKTPNTRISPHSKANISLKCLYVPKKVSSCLDDIRQRAGIMLFRFSSHKKISDYSKANISLRC